MGARSSARICEVDVTDVLIMVLALVVVLGVLVFVHEAGHFLAAKWAGIYVHRFSLGLGTPVPWLTFRRGETEYSISWLPLGGYVKMASREEDIGSSSLEGGQPEFTAPADRMFESKPIWKRMVVILAGVTMNALLAWGLYTFLVAKNGRPIDPTTRVGRVVDELLPPEAAALKQVQPGTRIVSVNGRPVSSWNQIQEELTDGSDPEVRLALEGGTTVVLPIHQDALEQRIKTTQALLPFRLAVVDSVAQGTPAAKAGIQAGDTIVGLDGRPIAQSYDLIEALPNRVGENVAVEVARAGGHVTVNLRPYLDSIQETDKKWRKVGRIGVALGVPVRVERLSLAAAVSEGLDRTIKNSTQIVRTVRGLFSGRISRREVGGPILIGQLAGQSAKLGLDVFLDFMALISINLAVLNLLPVPVLDGGQFLFLLAEAVIRRPLPLKLRERLTAVGLVLIVLLMGLAFSNDIRRLFGA
jgi:regulator of sigma E protease